MNVKYRIEDTDWQSCGGFFFPLPIFLVDSLNVNKGMLSTSFMYH